MTENKSQIDIIDPIIANKSAKKYDDYYEPKTIRKLHAMIYDWVSENYGHNEAEDPSWSIVALAYFLHEHLLDDYVQKITVGYNVLDERSWEEACNEYNK